MRAYLVYLEKNYCFGELVKIGIYASKKVEAWDGDLVFGATVFPADQREATIIRLAVGDYGGRAKIMGKYNETYVVLQEITRELTRYMYRVRHPALARFKIFDSIMYLAGKWNRHKILPPYMEEAKEELLIEEKEMCMRHLPPKVLLRWEQEVPKKLLKTMEAFLIFFLEQYRFQHCLDVRLYGDKKILDPNGSKTYGLTSYPQRAGDGAVVLRCAIGNYSEIEIKHGEYNAVYITLFRLMDDLIDVYYWEKNSLIQKGSNAPLISGIRDRHLKLSNIM